MGLCLFPAARLPSLDRVASAKSPSDASTTARLYSHLQIHELVERLEGFIVAFNVLVRTHIEEHVDGAHGHICRLLAVKRFEAQLRQATVADTSEDDIGV